MYMIGKGKKVLKIIPTSQSGLFIKALNCSACYNYIYLEMALETFKDRGHNSELYAHRIFFSKFAFTQLLFCRHLKYH